MSRREQHPVELLRTLSSRVLPVLASARHGPIGIDIGRTGIRLTQLGASSKKTLTLRSAGHAPLDSDVPVSEQLTDLLRQTLASGDFSGRDAVLAMPAGQYRMLSVSFRPTQQQSDSAAVAALMVDRLDGPLQDYAIDAIPVRHAAPDGEKLALVAVSKRQDVMDILAATERAGLRPSVMEIAPVALRRLVRQLDGREDRMTLILNTGHEHSYLTLLHGRRLLLDQRIEFGETALIDELCQTLSLNVDHARSLILRTGLAHGASSPTGDHRVGETGMFNTLLEILRPRLLELVDHTDRAFMYAAAQTHGAGQARIVLLGALARWPGCASVVADMTQLPVTVPDASELLDQPDGDRTDLPMPRFAVSAGLALRGLVDDA